jgi:hypothetical protein
VRLTGLRHRSYPGPVIRRLPCSLTCATYLLCVALLIFTTPLKPVALLEDGSSSSPSAAAATLASSAVSGGCGPSPLAFAASAAARSAALTCLTSHKAASPGVAKVPRWRFLLVFQIFATYLLPYTVTPLKLVPLLEDGSSSSPSAAAAALASSAVSGCSLPPLASAPSASARLSLARLA